MNWYLIAYESATGGQWRRCDAADEWAAALANLASGLRDAGALAHAGRLGAESAWMSIEVAARYRAALARIAQADIITPDKIVHCNGHNCSTLDGRNAECCCLCTSCCGDSDDYQPFASALCEIARTALAVEGGGEDR